MAATSNPLIEVAVVATVAIPRLAAATMAGAIAPVGGEAAGFAQQAAKAGETFLLSTSGTQAAIAGAAVAFGDELQVGANGSVVPLTSGVIVGVAFNDAASGDEVEVYLRCGAGGGAGNAGSGLSSKLIAAIPMRGNVASTGLPKDLSPSLATLLLMPGLNDATFYGTDEYGTVIAAANGGAILPKEQVSLSCVAGRNIGLLLCLKKAMPGATEAFLGWGDGTNPGVNLAMTSAGKLNVAAVARLVSSPATLSTHNLSASVVGIADADCPIALDINYQRQRIDLYVRGKYISTIVFAGAAGKREIPQLSSLVLGGIGGDNQTTFAAQFKGFIQVVVLDDNFTDFQMLAATHAANVSQPINGAVL